jgi:hypothetical protein
MPFGLAVMIVVSLLTEPPSKEVQELVEHCRYPSLDSGFDPKVTRKLIADTTPPEAR